MVSETKTTTSSKSTKPTSAQREVFVFVAFAFAFWALYVGIYEQILEPAHTFDNALNWFLAEQAVAVFHLFGHAAEVYKYSDWYPTMMSLDGKTAVYVGTSCNGFPMIYLFVAFIVSHPGPWRRKAWFVPAGVLVIHASNVLRVMALAVIAVYHREYFEVNHKYIYQIIVYTLIIVLFAWWHLRLSDPKLPIWPIFKRAKA